MLISQRCYERASEKKVERRLGDMGRSWDLSALQLEVFREDLSRIVDDRVIKKHPTTTESTRANDGERNKNVMQTRRGEER